MTTDEITIILQKHKNHLRKCKRESKEDILYWIGALDCIDNIASELGVEIE